MYSFLHVQVYPPAVFKQVALEEQLCVLRLHSSISVKVTNKNQATKLIEMREKLNFSTRGVRMAMSRTPRAIHKPAEQLLTNIDMVLL